MAKLDVPLVWLDLEMTGLDPDACAILELAVLLTGSDLVPVAEYEAVLWQPEEVLQRMEPVVLEMHTRNGLLTRVRASTLTVRDAETEAMRLVASHCGPGEGILAGSSIHTDRRFLIRHMPMLDRYLNYRMVDVSSLKVLARHWYPKVPELERGPREHTAMADIRASLAELVHARTTFFRGPDEISGA
ncbi:MAG: oligoribonuclease [Myxococcaceae bacterium]|nr:oligoribonuclease [Myxococcaceae bacterium]MCI0670156.1 oligoribonuclease [Myxococcaceae bacterium]